MKQKWQMTGALVLALFLAFAPLQARAADFEVENVFEDALYGAAIGALVGAGFMLISNNPGDNWNYIAVGAGVGIIGGAAYGVYTSSRPLSEFKDGEFRAGVPIPRVTRHRSRKGTAIAMEMDIFRSRF